MMFSQLRTTLPFRHVSVPSPPLGCSLF